MLPVGCTTLRQDAFERQTSNITPGPAALGAPPLDPVRPRSPSIVFGRSARQYAQPSATPGPDAYTPATNNVMSKSFDSRFPSSPITHFGSSSREHMRVSHSPAPDAYDVSTSTFAVRPRTPSYSIGTGTRDAHLLRTVSPGPGEYETKSALGKQSVSIRSSAPTFVFGSSGRANERVPAVPGPGAYRAEWVDSLGGQTVSSTRARSATMHMGSGRRFEAQLDGGPGPAYSPDHNAVRLSPPKFGFGTAPRDASPSKRALAAPGPGAYDSSVDALGRKPATSVRPRSATTRFGSSRRFDDKVGAGPAPGQYGIVEDKRFQSSPRPVFGTSSRDDMRPSNTPAPHAYSASVAAVRPRSAQFSFGSSHRFSGLRSAGSPGPGSYGAADYTATVKRAPTMHFGTSQRDRDHPSPAPGPVYEVDKSLGATKPRSPAYGLGSSSRFGAESKMKVPGPGEYGLAVKPLPSSPAYTMRAR